MEIRAIAQTEYCGFTKDMMGDYKSLTFAGLVGGVCFMKDSFNELLQQDKEKHNKRATDAILNTHHSLFGHEHITLCIEGIPKLMAMFLNNIGAYTTSEKSARYTIMKDVDPHENHLYTKWYHILIDLIHNKYNKLDGKKVEKLAQENARYMTSVFTPTTMIYTTTIADLFYILDICNSYKNYESANNFDIRIHAMMYEFSEKLSKYLSMSNRIDDEMMNFKAVKRNKFTLLRYDEYEWDEIKEYFGSTYITTYKGSFAQLAQAQRHRTLDYVMFFNGEAKEFYVPEILEGVYRDLWLQDIESVAEGIPQGTLVKISETGSFDNFLLKIRERECACAQLEIQKQTMATHKKFMDNVGNLTSKEATTLYQYEKMIRCAFTRPFPCKSPCPFVGDEKKTRCI